MSDDMFKKLNIEIPSMNFLEDVYKAQLVAMSNVRPVFQTIDDMNKLSLEYKQMFKFPVPKFSITPVDLGIDLEKLNEAFSRLNEPLLTSMKTIKSITAEQYRNTLFSEDISEKIHELTSLPLENIDYSIARLRIESHNLQSLSSAGSISAIHETEVNQNFCESKHPELPPIFKNHALVFNNMVLTSSGIELLRNIEFFDKLFASNQLLIFLVSYVIFLLTESKSN